jgi:hypothetical protein
MTKAFKLSVRCWFDHQHRDLDEMGAPDDLGEKNVYVENRIEVKQVMEP